MATGFGAHFKRRWQNGFADMDSVDGGAGFWARVTAEDMPDLYAGRGPKGIFRVMSGLCTTAYGLGGIAGMVGAIPTVPVI